MKKSLLALMVGASLVSAPLFATESSTDTTTTPSAKTNAPEPFQQAREKLKQMTPEQRQAFMKDARAKWDKLSPAEKQKFKVQMREKMHMMKKQRAERKMVKIYSLYLLEQEQQ